MPLIALHDATSNIFDYILVGAGTAGLTLAARLTEDSATTVLVLEAGESHLGDPVVDIPVAGLAQLHDPKYDWLHKTVPQTNANNRQLNWNRGKGLGGSSAMNMMLWNVPPAVDIDNWEKLGNPGWNFKNYQKYHNKARGLKSGPPLSPDISTITGDIGTGPLKTSYSTDIQDSTVIFQKTLHQLGLSKATDPDNGDPIGAYFGLSSLDPATHRRSYSANAYYSPNASRPNLSVLLTAHANRVITETHGDNLTATGVEFRHGSEEIVHVAQARKQVILCAGALKSPQILELSGIGRPEVLGSLGIPVKVALDGVGENVQEHTMFQTLYVIKDDSKELTTDMLRDPVKRAEAAAAYPQGKGLFNTGYLHSLAFVPLDSLSSRADEIHQGAKEFIRKEVDSGKYSPGLSEQYALQLERLESPETNGGCEVLLYSGFTGPRVTYSEEKKYASVVVIHNHPFSRGSIHAVSNDPRQDPAFDPQYFEHDVDLETSLEMVKFARKMGHTKPWSDILESGETLNPPVTQQHDADLLDWMRDSVMTTWHTVGSLSMLPRDKGGVVDSHLKVYGTTNIRVADLSIVPLHFSGHSQATAYVVGEIAGDIVKGRFS
ncbi:hypothetical protein C8J56DRAFT_936647 [Mycena floridula]|nr:hypothetical protein C8J56DRAFT_936647 [Mycena floridula]